MLPAMFEQIKTSNLLLRVIFPGDHLWSQITTSCTNRIFHNPGNFVQSGPVDSSFLFFYLKSPNSHLELQRPSIQTTVPPAHNGFTRNFISVELFDLWWFYMPNASKKNCFHFMETTIMRCKILSYQQLFSFLALSVLERWFLHNQIPVLPWKPSRTKDFNQFW